jgi:hypothetical protein
MTSAAFSRTYNDLFFSYQRLGAAFGRRQSGLFMKSWARPGSENFDHGPTKTCRLQVSRSADDMYCRVGDAIAFDRGRLAVNRAPSPRRISGIGIDRPPADRSFVAILIDVVAI